MAKKIVFSSLCHPGSREANAIQIDHMCNELVCQGNKLTLTAIGAKKAATEYRTVLLPWKCARLRSRLMRIMTYFLVRWQKPDYLITRSPLLALPAFRNNVDTIIELHALPRSNSESELALKLALQDARLRRIITISGALANDLVEAYGCPHSDCDILVLHDGAVSGKRPGPPAMTNNPLRVGYFGQLYPGKGMETIASIAPLVPELRFDVYGGADVDLYRWRAMCEVQNNIVLHGHIAHANVRSRMCECDILIAPYGPRVAHSGTGDISRWMSPLKIFEYMAAARPIVTSDLPVLREVLRNNETALLCQPGDVQAYVAALRRLAADFDLRNKLGSAGRDLLEAKYTWENRAKRVFEGID